MPNLYHCNSAGLIGGFPVCGQQTGFVTPRYHEVNCRPCLVSMVDQGYVPTLEQASPLGWHECPGCRAGIKHVHCRNPWQDEGGG